MKPHEIPEGGARRLVEPAAGAAGQTVPVADPRSATFQAASAADPGVAAMDSHGPVVQPAPDADPGVRATGVTAVVPLRDGVSGKSRLASVLDDDARRALITVLAQHVVGTLLATPQVDGVVVVTADAPFARSALGELSDVGHLAFLAQPTDRPGLNAALDAAREAIGSRLPETAPGGIDVAPGGAPTPHALLVAHADLPALTPGDITDLVMPAAGHASRRRPERPATRHPAGRASSDPADRPAPASGGDAPSGRPHAADVVIATDRMGQGTNLLLLRPGAEHEFRFRFGPASRAAHEAEAARLGLRAVTISSPGTAVDLDTVDDWNELPAAVRSAVGRYARFPSP